MKFIVKREDLKSLTRIITTIFGKSNIGILFVVEKKSKEVLVSCGEKNTWLNYKIPATECEHGSFAVDYSSICNITFPKDTVSFALVDSAIELKSGAFTSKMSVTIDPKDVLKAKPLKLIKVNNRIDPAVLSSGISALNYAAILAGKDTKDLTVKITKSGELILSTNDSYRGGVFKATTKLDRFKISVDFDAMKNLMGIIAGAKQAELGTDSKQIRIKTGAIDCQLPTFQTKKDSSAEEFMAQLPKNSKVSFLVDSAKYKTAIESMSSIAANTKANELKIESVVQGSKVSMKAEMSGNKASYNLKVQKKEGKDHKFFISNKMVLDLLGLASGIIKLTVFDKVALISSTKLDAKYVFPLL
jgi:DNA polymerase III sliding clamp (beta) subunit (PCNA family)